MALNASSHVVVLDVRVKGGNQAAAAMQKTGAATEQAGVKAEKTKREFASLAGAFTALFAAGMVRRGFESLVKPAVEFDTALTRLRTITGANEDQMKAYEKRARAVAAITPYGPTEMVAALQELRRATGSTDVALAALEGTAKVGLATMGKMGLEGATRMTTETIKTFGLSTHEVVDAMERIAALALATGTNLESFETTMARLGTVATVTGQSLDQVMMAATLAGRGVTQPTRNVQLLSSALKMLQQKEARAVLENIGVTVMDPMSGAMRDLSSIFTDMANRMMTEPVKVRAAMTAAFGQRGGESVGAVLNQLTGAFKDVDGKVLKTGEVFAYLRGKVRESGGTLDKMGKDYVASAAGQFELFKEKVEDAARALGQVILPMFIEIARVLGTLAKGFADLVSTDAGKFIFGVAGKGVALYAGAWALKALWFGISKIFLNVASNIGMIGVNANLAAAGLANMGRASGAAGAASAGGGLLAGAGGLAARMAKGGAWPLALAAGAAMVASQLLGGDGKGGGSAQTKTQDKLGWFGKWRLSAGRWAMGDEMFKAVGNRDIERRMGFWAKLQMDVSKWIIGGDTLRLLDQELSTQRKINKEHELAKRNIQDTNAQLQIGTEAYKNMLSGASGMADYTPPVVSGRTFSALENRLRSARGSVGGDDQRRIDYTLRAASTARGLVGKAQRGIISPQEQSQLLNAVRLMRNVGMHVNQIYGPGLIGGELLKNFGTKVSGQLAKMGTDENVAYMRDLALAGGMNYPNQPGVQIPGTSAAAGGHGSAPGAMLMRDYPWHSAAYPSPGAKDRSKMETIAQQTLTEAGYQRSVMERIYTVLSKPLEVTVTRRDPMGGQSQPDFFPG